MTPKGQRFVGREIGRLIRKGPGSGPQKGQKMAPKQAVATALNVARQKGYKTPPRNESVTLYRGPEYGAIAVLWEGDTAVTYNHNSADASAVLAVLEQSMRPERRDDGGVTWRLSRGHRQVGVEANVRRAVQTLGYTSDPLSERAILSISREEAASPDLPGEAKFHLVHEALEAGLRRHVEIAIAALHEHGRVTPPTVRLHARPNSLDTFGRPLPFLVARAFIETQDTAAVENTLREALRAVESYVVRATVCESDGLATIEVALAPNASICEAYMDTSIPTFESHAILGARTVWISLETPLDLEEATDISALAAASTGAVGLRTERDGRAIVAHIPSSNEGVHVADHAFQDRLGWLMRLLDPWDPDVKDIGEQRAVQAGAPGHRDGLTEVSGGDTSPGIPPSSLDAQAIEDLDAEITNSISGFGNMQRAFQQLGRKKSAGQYRRDQAASHLLKTLVDPTAKDYVQSEGGSLEATFPRKEREFLAMELAKRFERSMSEQRMETFSPTPGLVRAAFKTPGSARQCGECGLGMPKYVGRYPSKCPQCGGDVVMAESDEDLAERQKEKRRKRKGISAAEHKKEALAARLRRKKLTPAQKAVLAKRQKFLRKESMDEATRKEVGSSVLGPAVFNMNVAKISGAQARSYAEKLYSQADDANLEADLPDLDRNFSLLKSKMRFAKNLRRDEMPVIDPEDIVKFGKRLKSGHIDIFEPWADVSKVYNPEVAARMPELGSGKFPDWKGGLQGGTKGRLWVTLGRMDGDQKDDAIPASITMVPVKNLKPLQNEIFYDKLIASILKFGVPAAGGFLLTNAIIIVSQDGYILDGHHRFGQAMLTDPSLKIKALVVPLGIDKLLKVTLSYGAAIGHAPRGAGPRESVQAGGMVKMKGSGKTTDPSTPKGSVASVGQPTAPDVEGDEDLLARLRNRIKAIKAKA